MKKLIPIIILVSALVLAVTSFWDDSIIVDEVPHIGAGYGYMKKADYRLNPEHPPLIKDVAAVPLLFMDLNQTSFQTKFWQDDLNGQWEFGRHLIFQAGNDADAITRAVKSAILIFFVLSSILLYRWTKSTYGDNAGLIALTLFSFSPTVMAHARYVATDVGAMFGILIGTFFFIRYVKAPSKKTLLAASAAFGLAQLTKFSVILLVPFFILLAVAWPLANRSGFKELMKTVGATFLIFIIGFLVIVGPVYLHHTWNYPIERQRFDTEFILSSFGNRLLADPVVVLSGVPYVRAFAQYGLGLLMVMQRSVGGNTTYFLGEVNSEGWKHYFPVVYFIKEPLAWWSLALLSIIYFFAVRARRLALTRLREWIKNNFETFAFLLFIAIYWGATFRSNLNIGVRHLLPTYPFAIMLVSGKLGEMINTARKKLALGLIITALLGWYVFENIRVWPYYLTYFNQTAGGAEGGYRYVVDSNLDWGQDLKRVSTWVEEHNVEKLHFDYFGWADPAYYLGDKRIWLWAGKYTSIEEFLADNPEGGYIAVSLSFYMGSRGEPETSYAWLDPYEPVAKIGNSIWIWEIRPSNR